MKTLLTRVAATIVFLTIAFSINTKAADQGTFDVLPEKHWVYDALFVLRDKGVIREYSESMFDPSRLITRYEAALTVARYLTNDNQIKPVKVMSTLNPEHRVLMNRLVNEYAHELSLLGISTSDIVMNADVVANKKKAMIPIPNVSKASGEADEIVGQNIPVYGDLNDNDINIVEPTSEEQPSLPVLNSMPVLDSPGTSPIPVISTPRLPVPDEGPLGPAISVERGRVKRRIARRRALEERDLVLKRLSPKISADHIWSRTILQGIDLSTETESDVNEYNATSWPGFTAIEELRFIRNRDFTPTGYLTTDITLSFSSNMNETARVINPSGHLRFDGRLWDIQLGEILVGKTSFEHHKFSQAGRLTARRGSWEIGGDFGQHWGGLNDRRFYRPAWGLDTEKTFSEVWLGGLRLSQGKFGVRYYTWRDDAAGMNDSTVPGVKSTSVVLTGYAHMKFNRNLSLNLESAAKKTDDSRDLFTSDESRAYDARLAYRKGIFRLNWHYRNLERDFERFASVEYPAESSNLNLAIYANRRLLLEGGHRWKNIITRGSPNYNQFNPHARITFYPSSRYESLRMIGEYNYDHRESRADNSYDRKTISRRLTIKNTIFKTAVTGWGLREHLFDDINDNLSYRRWNYGLSMSRHMGDTTRINASWDRDVQTDRTNDENFELSANIELPLDTDMRVYGSSSDRDRPGTTNDLLVNKLGLSVSRMVHEGREFQVSVDHSRNLYRSQPITYRVNTIGAEYAVRF